MTQKWRCDTCKKAIDEDELKKIVDRKRRIWYRCENCIKEWGIKPRSDGYYAFIQFEGAMGFEDPDKVVPYGPRKKA